MACWVIPDVVAGYLWFAFLHADLMGLGTGSGLFNSIVGVFGVPQRAWLQDLPMASIIVANTWRGTAFSMLLYASALEGISPELLEAASIDGAGLWARVRKIILPMLKGTIATDLLLITLATLSDFTLVMVLTGGGPGFDTQLLTIYMYQHAFKFYELGYGTAIALLIILAGATCPFCTFAFCAWKCRRRCRETPYDSLPARPVAYAHPDRAWPLLRAAVHLGHRGQLHLERQPWHGLVHRLQPRQLPLPDRQRLHGTASSNSIVLGVSTMVLMVVLSCGAGYTLSRYHFRFKQTVMLLILFCTGLPVLALIFPLYALYVRLNLIDSTPGVVLFFVASGLPFNMWLMKNFLDSVSIELEEAAWVDGCSTFGSFVRVVLAALRARHCRGRHFQFRRRLHELLRAVHHLQQCRTSFPPPSSCSACSAITVRSTTLSLPPTP